MVLFHKNPENLIKYFSYLILSRLASHCLDDDSISITPISQPELITCSVSFMLDMRMISILITFVLQLKSSLLKIIACNYSTMNQWLVFRK